MRERATLAMMAALLAFAVAGTLLDPPQARSERLGDANGDGRLDVGDAVLAIRNGLGLPGLDPSRRRLVDVNGDGEANAQDGVLILRSALGVQGESLSPQDAALVDNNERLISEGRLIFRYDTFGNPAFWGDALQLHQAIQGEARGGIGLGLSPRAALGLGLKVDSEALPEDLVQQLVRGQVDLDDPATTLALLKLDAVVGVTGFFEDSGRLRSVGIQCALCHSTVDDALAPGIGRRLDGWANRDLDVGAVIALAPSLKPLTDLLGVDDATARTVLRSWGPGKFDASLTLDGKAFRPDGKPAAVLIPPAYGLAGVNLATWTGWGTVTYWNAFVANLEMHGKGRFFDTRLRDADRFPVAARAGLDNIVVSPEEDQITPKLAALHAYQLSLPAPTPPEGSFSGEAAARGQALFNGKAACASCHVPPLFSEPGHNLHKGSEIGVDDFQAERSPTGAYRTAPLKGLWAHQKGGFFHDGRFGTLEEVVEHYNGLQSLGLTASEKADLVEYLKSL